MPVARAKVRSGPVGGRADLRYFWEYTGPASYPNGGTAPTSGESLTAGGLDLGTVEVFPSFMIHSGSAVRLCVYDYDNQRLRIYIPDTGAEVADAVDLSTFTGRFEVVGY